MTEFLEFPKMIYHPEDKDVHVIVQNAHQETEQLEAWGVGEPPKLTLRPDPIEELALEIAKQRMDADQKRLEDGPASHDILFTIDRYMDAARVEARAIIEKKRNEGGAPKPKAAPKPRARKAKAAH